MELAYRASLDDKGGVPVRFWAHSMKFSGRVCLRCEVGVVDVMIETPGSNLTSESHLICYVSTACPLLSNVMKDQGNIQDNQSRKVNTQHQV